MDIFERAIAFRKAAQNAGLMLDELLHPVNVSIFDLNMGTIIASHDPEKVMSLVKLAREHVEHDIYGEHNALLDLVTPRDEVDCGNRCYWSRPYHVRYDPDTWITLKEWLEEHGQNPDSIYGGSQ